MEKDEINFHKASSFEDDDLFLDFNDEPNESNNPKYESAERVLHLIHLLTSNEYSKQDIFERLKDYYRIDEGNEASIKASSRKAYRMGAAIGQWR